MQPHADVFGRLVGKRPNINVGLITVAQNELDRNLDQFVDALGKGHGKNLRRGFEPLVMVAQQDQKELALFGHPIASNALKAAGTVLKAVREQPDFGIFVAREAALRIDRYLR